MTVRVYNYHKELMRPVIKYLSYAQQRMEKRLPPPQEELAEMFGYDHNMRRLFCVHEGAVRYVPNEDLFVIINQYHYAIWRVKSMLLLGNAMGVPPEYEQLKEFQPPDTPALIVPPVAALHPPKMKRRRRRRKSYEGKYDRFPRW